MRTRDPRTIVMAVLVLAFAWLSLSALVARAQTRANGKPSEAGIRQAIQSYVTAFNKKDVEAVMAHWTDDAEFLEETGKPITGRAALTAMFKKTFEERKDTTLKVRIKTIRFLKPDVAIQDGVATDTAGDGTVDSNAFTAVWTQVDGKWLLARVQDLPGDDVADADTNYQYLKVLEWLVGDWETTDKDNRVTMTCKWTRNRNFLLIEQSYQLKDREVMSATQVIGWDPRVEQVRSWVFDAGGGFGEGVWTRDGNRWIVKSEGITSDNVVASATNVWKFVDDNTFEWDSTNREIDGVPTRDFKLKFVRKSAGK
jgi:uncharacterized protein (TIGR02246 family)